METTIKFPGFEGQRLVLRATGIFSSAKLFLDGQPAPKGPKRGQYTLRRNDGSQVVAQLKISNLISPYPQLIIDGQPIKVGEQLVWYQWIWAGLPLLLLFMGGMLGGLYGGLATFLNGRILYSHRSQPAKFILSGLISLAAVAAFVTSVGPLRQGLADLFAGVPKEFVSQNGNFSIQTPVRLVENVQSMDLQAGVSVDMHAFSGELRDFSYLVAYSDYPQDIFAGVDPQVILAGSRDGAVTNVDGTLVSDNEITMQDYPGRQLMINGKAEQGQAMVIHSRMYLVRNRLYQVMVVLPANQTLRAEAEGFLTSFKLLNP